MKVTPHYDKTNKLTHVGIDDELYLADHDPKVLHSLDGTPVGILHRVGHLSKKGSRWFVEPYKPSPPAPKPGATEMTFKGGLTLEEIAAHRVDDSSTLARFTEPTEDAIRFPSIPLTFGAI
jgi:hypothetical protein